MFYKKIVIKFLSIFNEFLDSINFFWLIKHKLYISKLNDIFLKFKKKSNNLRSLNVLIDGLWYNQNYWLRYLIFRQSLKTKYCFKETVIIGKFNKFKIKKTIYGIKINNYFLYDEIKIENKLIHKYFDPIKNSIKNGQEFLKLKFPNKFPSIIIYDSILKKQRLATLNINDKNFFKYLKQCIKEILVAKKIIENGNYNLIISSHPFDTKYGGLVWAALRKGIRVVIPFGAFGLLRFVKMEKVDDIYKLYENYNKEFLQKIEIEKQDKLINISKKYLNERFSGKTFDHAGKLAFKKNASNLLIDKKKICKAFNWKFNKPIIIFYGSNWFDWPHQSGMSNFKDFYEWTIFTCNSIKRDNRYNYIFKPHPCEHLYGGPSLSNVIKDFLKFEHIKLSNKEWDSSRLMLASSGIITFHGTIGIESAAIGKPVLVPDKGKYESSGFVLNAKNKSAYKNFLNEDWINKKFFKQSRNLALLFAAFWFAKPKWQKQLVYFDDIFQDDLMNKTPKLLSQNIKNLGIELDNVSGWFSSKVKHYQKYKILNNDNY